MARMSRRAPTASATTAVMRTAWSRLPAGCACVAIESFRFQERDQEEDGPSLRTGSVARTRALSAALLGGRLQRTSGDRAFCRGAPVQPRAGRGSANAAEIRAPVPQTSDGARMRTTWNPRDTPCTRPGRGCSCWSCSSRSSPLLASSDAFHRQLTWVLETASPIIAEHPISGASLFVVLSALSAMLAFVSSAVLVPVAVQTWGEAGTAVLLWVGWILGGLCAYGVARTWGRPVIRRLVSERALAQYDARVSPATPFGLVVLFQLAVPSEIPGYVLGLARYPLRRYLAAVALAELAVCDRHRVPRGERRRAPARAARGVGRARHPAECAGHPRAAQAGPFFLRGGDTAARMRTWRC